MRKKKKTLKFRVSEYYDGGLIRLDNLPVPSKRVGYKKENGILVARVPLGVPEFENAIKETFSESSENWPLEGRLLVGVAISLPKTDYKAKDIDNMAKSILDAFCGVTYKDDKQIDALFVSKSVAQNWQVWIALKTLEENPKTWFLEPMMIRIPEGELEET